MDVDVIKHETRAFNESLHPRVLRGREQKDAYK